MHLCTLPANYLQSSMNYHDGFQRLPYFFTVECIFRKDALLKGRQNKTSVLQQCCYMKMHIHSAHKRTKWKEHASHFNYWLTEKLHVVPERHLWLLCVPPPFSLCIVPRAEGRQRVCRMDVGESSSSNWVSLE